VQFFQWGWNTSKFFLPIEIFVANKSFCFCSNDSPYSIRNIPFVGRPYVLNVIDCLKAISFTTHARSKLKDLNHNKFHIDIVHWILTTFMVMFCLNSSLLISTINLTKCKEWTWSMMAMRGARLIQLTSRRISTLLFKGLSVWAICNAKMIVTIFFFLMDVKMKQPGAMTLLMILKGNFFCS